MSTIQFLDVPHWALVEKHGRFAAAHRRIAHTKFFHTLCRIAVLESGAAAMSAGTLTHITKEQLMGELAGWIEQHHLKQAEAAEIMVVSRPRVSDVVNRKTAKFTIETLVEILSRIVKTVCLAIGR